MVLRIFEMIATSGFLTYLKCTKFVFDLGSARNPLRELTALAGLSGPTSKGAGRGGKGNSYTLICEIVKSNFLGLKCSFSVPKSSGQRRKGYGVCSSRKTQ